MLVQRLIIGGVLSAFFFIELSLFQTYIQVYIHIAAKEKENRKKKEKTFVTFFSLFALLLSVKV